MRATRQSTFRQPLDELLGTVSCVRVVRELTLHGEPLSASELAERTTLSRPSAGDAVTKLVELNAVETIGTGRYVQYRLRESHFLARALQDLFRQEARRRSRVFEALRETAEHADPGPRAVWLYGSVARGEDRPGSDLDLLVVASSSESRQALGDLFRDALADLEDRWNLPPCSVVVVTETEVREGMDDEEEFFLRLRDDAVPLFGQLPPEAPDRG